jgi:hypothetical protein
MKKIKEKSLTPKIIKKHTTLARSMFYSNSPEIIQKVIDQALDGDVQCLKMCIDRILPVHKAADYDKSKSEPQIIINIAGLPADKELDITTAAKEIKEDVGT